MIGQLIDQKYEVLRQLGEGGMGAVYEALHTGTRRKVAIKVITDRLKANKDLVDRFIREARVAGAIDTQHIAQVFDTGIDGETDAPFMVMELLVGEDLQQMVRRLGPLPPDLALRIGAQACLGLAKAHEAGVIHRDIKPANLFLMRRDAGEVIVKLLDFGVAKMKEDQLGGEGDHALTKTGAMLGSPLYMSPEQAKGARELDQRADIWSLGVVLYEAMCGRTPFHHIDRLGELIVTICVQPPPMLQDFAPWVTPEIAALVHGALQADPANRYPTATAMFNAIRGALPQGYGIYDQMLAAMPMESKTRVAPRLAATSPGTAITGSSFPGLTQVPQITGADTIVSGGGSAGGVSSSGTTDPGVTAAGVTPKRSPLLAVVGGAVVLGVGLGGYLAMRASTAPIPAGQGAQSVATAATAPPATATQAAVSASASGSASTGPATPATRTVRLIVLPDGALVTVDGKEVTPKDGVIELTGALGSKHAVRVAQGKSETSTDVLIGDDGAFPPKVELAAAPGPGKPGGKGKAAEAPSAKPNTPSGKTTLPGLDKTFQ